MLPMVAHIHFYAHCTLWSNGFCRFLENTSNSKEKSYGNRSPTLPHLLMVFVQTNFTDSIRTCWRLCVSMCYSTSILLPSDLWKCVKSVNKWKRDEHATDNNQWLNHNTLNSLEIYHLFLYWVNPSCGGCSSLLAVFSCLALLPFPMSFVFS